MTDAKCEPPKLTAEEWLDEAAAVMRKAGWNATVETAPVTPPAVVAALVEALEAIVVDAEGDGNTMSVKTANMISASIALYRGEAER